MFSCLGRLGCLFLILVAGAYAYLTRDRWIARVTGGTDSTTVTWQPVTDPGAKEAEQALAALQRKDGPAYVTMSAAELAALMVESTGHRNGPRPGARQAR